MTTQPLDPLLALSPCPFCGRQPRTGFASADIPGMPDCGYHYIECCDVHIHRDFEDESVTAWNTRPQSLPEAELPEVTDEQYADTDALIAHLDSLMDDGGQGGEKWEPAQAAILGIRIWLGLADASVIERGCFAMAKVAEFEDQWPTEYTDEQQLQIRTTVRAILESAYGQQCAATRPAEVGGDGLPDGMVMVPHESLRYLAYATRGVQVCCGHGQQVSEDEIACCGQPVDAGEELGKILQAATPPTPGSEAKK